MALPKIDVPIYTLELLSSGKEISYRPFLVKEEKILLMAMEGGDEKEITTAIKQIITNCVLTDFVDVDKLPLFDIEYLLLNLRSKSTGDIIKTSYTRKNCPEKDCKPVEIEIDINSVQIDKDNNHNKKIQITNEVGIIMKYPNINLINEYNKNKSDKSLNEGGFDLIKSCVDKVYDSERVYTRNDFEPSEDEYNSDDLQELLESLNKEQFSKIEEFFETMPTMYKDVEFNCEKCGYKEDMRLEGLTSFFG